MATLRKKTKSKSKKMLGDGMAGRTGQTVEEHNTKTATRLEQITGIKPKRWGK